jgi:hypothetical protein
MGKKVWKYGCSYCDTKGNRHIKRVYSIWSNMINRCIKSENKDYSHYGGRGITVCDEWLSYDNFYEWAVANGYEDNLTLDRKDNDKEYSPDNCRWVDMSTQSRNRRTTVYIEGISLKDYAERKSLNYNVTKYRKRKGIDILAPRLKSPRLCEGMTLKDISAVYDIKFSTLSSRWIAGARTLEELTKPVRGAK